MKFNDYIFKKPKVRTYLPIENERSFKHVLMQNRIVRSPDFQEYNAEKQFEVNTGHEVGLKYENFNTQEVLKQVLPDGVEIPGGFEIIGTIVHLNLSDAQMPYRKIIGEVIKDKNPSIMTVVAKIGQI